MTIARKIDLEQGTPEWLEWRSYGIGGTDAGSIMGTSPWTSAIELYQRKVGILPPIETNEAMQRGHDLEPEGRVAFELETGLQMSPGCFEHPEYDFMRASLDGISADGKFILEVKCPGLTTHREALAGKIKPYYQTQMQHCMAVTGAQMCYYVSYTDAPDIENVKIIKVPRDEANIQNIIWREKIFWDSVLNKTEPDASIFAVGDAGELRGETRNDPAWLKAVEEVLSAHEVLEDAKAQFDIRIKRINELLQRRRQVRVRHGDVIFERTYFAEGEMVPVSEPGWTTKLITEE